MGQSTGTRVPASPVASVRRPVRFAIVSVVAGGLAQLGLLVAYGVFGWGTTAASLFSLAVSVGPSYVGCRAYVWPQQPGRARRRHVTSFVTVAVLGTATAVVLTALTARLGAALTDDRLHLTVWVSAGSVAATVVVWVARYLVLDRYVFSPVRSTPMP